MVAELFFSRKKKKQKGKHGSYQAVSLYFKCLHMFIITVKGLVKKHLKLIQDYFNSTSKFLFPFYEGFHLHATLSLSCHSHDVSVPRESPLSLQLLSAMLSSKEESSQLLSLICMTHTTSPLKAPGVCKNMLSKTALNYSLELYFTYYCGAN